MKMKKVLAGITAASLVLSSLSIVLLADDEAKSEPLVEWKLSPTEEEAAVDPDDKENKKWGGAPENNQYLISVDEDIVGEVNKVVVNVTSDVYANGQLGANVNATEAKPWGADWGQTEWTVAAAGTQDITIDNMLEDGGFGQLVAGQALKFTLGYLNFKDGNDPDSVSTFAINSVKFYNSQGTLLGELPSDTTKVVVKYNSWEGGSNYQGTYSIAVPGITDLTTAAEAIEILTGKVVTVSFSYDSAICNGAAFDTSKLSASGVLQAYGGETDQIWESYSSTAEDGLITIVMDDLAEKLKKDPTHTSVNIMVAFAIETANVPEGADAIRVYLSDLSATVSDKEVPVKGVTLDPISLSLEKGKKATITATVDPENATYETVEWTIGDNDNKVVSIKENADGSCEVTAVGAGTATITAKAGDKTAECEVTVTVPATKVTLDEKLFLLTGETKTLTAALEPADSTDKVTWTSNDETVATVDGGKVTAKAKGTAIITATAREGVSATCEVTVADPAKAITLSDITVLTGEEKAIAYTVDPEGAEISNIQYTSSNDKVFTITDGKVKGVGAGTATLTMTAANAGNTKLTAECTVTVTDEAIAATAVTLSDTAIELEVEGTKTLTATLTPAGSTDKITWSSSDEAVAKVDQTGKVTALKVGEAIITAKANDTVSATCKVTVTAKTIAITSVTLNKTAATVEEGETVQLEATVNPETTTEDKTVSWSTSDETVATVDNTGKVTAVKAGEAVITAKAGTKTAECTITVTAKVSEGEGTVDPDDGLIIEVDDEDITIEADSDTFEETVTVVKAEVSVNEDVAEEKTEAIADAVKDILDGEESTVEVGAVISITLKDQDGNEIQPVSGGVVTITVPYDGKSNYAAYIDGTAAEFIKLVINEAKTYASFDAKHFSDYYLVALSDEAADAIDKENGENEEPKPDDPKPDDPKPDDPKPGDDDKNKVEKTYEGSMVVNDTAYWSEFEVALDKLIGEFAPEDVKSVEFTCADHDFQIGYNNTAGTWSQITVKKGEKALQTDIVLTEANYALKIGISAGDGVDYTISWVTTALVEDDGSGDDNKDDKDNINIAFEDKAYELEVVDATGWSGGEYTKAAQVNAEVNIGGITYGTTTFGDIKNKTVTLSDIVYKNCEIEGVKASDIEIYIYMLHGETGSETWVGSEAGSMADKTVTWDLSTLAEAKAAIPDSSPIQAIGYQINIKGSVVKAIEDMEIGAKVKVNEAGGSGDDDNKTETVIWEGTYNAGTDWDWDSRLIIEAAKFANASAGDTIKIDFTINGEATYHQIQIKDGANDGILTSPEGVNEWAAIDVSTEGFSFVLNDADTATLKAKGMQLMGYDVTYKSVTLVTSGSGTPSQPSTPSEPSTPSAPSGNNYTIPTTSGSPSGETTTETTSAPAAASAPAESEQAAPTATEEDTSTNTTSPYATADSGDDVQPTEAGAAIPDDGNDGNVGNAGAGNAEDKNVGTGVALALIPAIAAAAAVVISKKRK